MRNSFRIEEKFSSLKLSTTPLSDLTGLTGSVVNYGLIPVPEPFAAPIKKDDPIAVGAGNEFTA